MVEILEYTLSISIIIWCMTFFYIVNYLRRSGATDLALLQTVACALSGNIANFYKAFYSVHSQKHKAINTIIILTLNISSILCFLVAIVSVAFLSIWFDI